MLNGEWKEKGLGEGVRDWKTENRCQERRSQESSLPIFQTPRPSFARHSHCRLHKRLEQTDMDIFLTYSLTIIEGELCSITRPF